MPILTVSVDDETNITREINPIMKPKSHRYPVFTGALSAILLTLFPSTARALEPDLTAPGVIEALKLPGGNSQYGARSYDDTFNLGATGMRGWIYDHNDRALAGELGLTTDLSRKILVTTVGPNTPAAGILQKDDVILGVSWGNDPVRYFSKDARKSFGEAITEAERIINGGAFNLKVWRAGQPATITDKSITLAAIDTYSATAPYNCPKSTKILANARAQLVRELIANPNFLSSSYSFGGAGAVNGLALLSVVAKGDADYPLVEARLKSCVENLDAPYLDISATEDKPIWRLAYQNIFLSEYYMRSVENGAPNATALAKLNKYTVALARAQSRFGTFGHGGSMLKTNGSLHGTVPPYGPVNCAGIAANLSIVLGKKALLAGGLALDPEIDPAIDRANKFFGYYVNKGAVPYGEHSPELTAHSLNGKDEMCAVMFSLQSGHQTEAEYFSRISTAGYEGRELGHNGAGFNYLWEGMGANVGGPLAAAAYLRQIQWSLDLERRTDGSFTYDGQRTAASAGSTTGDGTYLGLSQYYGLNPTACHILTYSVPLKRLYISGKNTNAATLDSVAVGNAILAGDFQMNISSVTNEVLITKLGEYDPVVREAAAKELFVRKTSNPLSSTQVTALVASITNGTLGTTNAQIGACTVLGLLQTPSALSALMQRLSDTNLWVKGKAASALANLGPAASSQVNTMLQVYTKNAVPDSEVVDWVDPVQISSGFLSDALFSTLAGYTITSPKNLFYPAIKSALKQPNSLTRKKVAEFAYNYLTYDDAKALTADLVECVTTTAQADTMFSCWPRGSAIDTLRKHRIFEGVQAAMSLLTIPRAYDWGSSNFINPGLDALVSFGYASTPYLPALRQMAIDWPLSGADQKIIAQPKLLDTIAKIEKSISYPNNNILSFEFPGFPTPTISGTNITLNVSAGTNVTALAPTFTYSSTAFCPVASGITRNFSTPQLYPVVAADLTLTTKIYTVAVVLLPAPPTITVNKLPDGYVKLGDEGVVNLFLRETDVAYGGGDNFRIINQQKGTITFNNALFGDPAPGVRKSGYCRIPSTITVNKLPEGYTKIGDEGVSNFFLAETDVAYGGGDNFKIIYKQKGNIIFNNAFFGDPAPGVIKSGYYRDPLTTKVNKLPEGYTKIGDEGVSNFFSEENDVAYGGGDNFKIIYKQKGNITFNNAFFGDPAPGVMKSGYYRNSYSTTVNKLPAGYTKIGDEGVSNFFLEETDVAYGGGDNFKIIYKQKGAITFSNALFGDPAPGVSKSGYYKNLSTVPTQLAVSQIALVSRASVSTAVSGLPLPWTPGNIGSGTLTGTTSYNGATISQSGSGALGVNSDKLNFSYQPLSGDGEITAKISALQDTGMLSGVGVMIRETLATNSTYVFMGMSGSNTYRASNRTTTGGIATGVNSGTGVVPNTWVKLVRVGNVITASRSIDGTTWIPAGSTTVTMATSSYIGLAVSSGSDATLNNSQFSNLSVTP
jgi:Family of unknown function (DUF6288)